MKIQQLENKKKESERELEEAKIEIKMAAQVREVELASLREEADRAQRMLDWRQERRTMRDLAEAQVYDMLANARVRVRIRVVACG